MPPEQIIGALISILTSLVLFVVTTSRSEGQRDRTKILEMLEGIQEKQADHETRLSILEHDFADIDPHPSRHKRPV